MHDYRQKSVYSTPYGLRPVDFKPLSPEDTTTYRNWRRSVLLVYAAVLLLGGIGLLASSPLSKQEVAQITRR